MRNYIDKIKAEVNQHRELNNRQYHILINKNLNIDQKLKTYNMIM